MTPSKAVLLDRAAGVIVASAAGDALGAPHEFGGPIPVPTQLTMSGGGTFGWAPGEWTDDSQMALALLTPLAEGDTSVDAVEKGFVAWYGAGPRDVGNQTSAVLRAGAPLSEAARRYTNAHAQSAAGNGGLMRVGPAGLAFAREPEATAHYAAAVTRLTHADADCVDASVLWAVAIDHAIHLAPPSSQPFDFAAAVRAGLDHLAAPRRGRWAQLIDEASREPISAFGRNGWVVHAFQAALAAIVQTPVPKGNAPCIHLVRSIEAAVRAGGDTDTVAAIAGSLLGARWGATAVPLRWRALLHGERRHGEAFLRADELDALARLAFRHGKPDSIGFPTTPRLAPYYLAHYGGGPAPVQIDGALFGGVKGLGAALGSGATAVVSLCRMGSEDLPAGVEHHRVGLIDGPADDNPNLAFVLADTADFVADRVGHGASVYVHCVSADNRAPAVALTYAGRCSQTPLELCESDVRAKFGHLPGPTMLEGVRQAVSLERR